MEDRQKYKINMDDKFGFLNIINIPDLVKKCTDKWYNQTLCRVNDCIVRLGIFHGEFHWHIHEEEDEFFLVLDGKLYIDLDDQTIILQPHQGYSIPKGVNHRTREIEKTTVIMVEGSSVKPTGD